MALDFDTDPIGAILEFAFLQERYPGADRAQAKQDWNRQNIRQGDIELLQPWGGPEGTLTKSHLINVLSAGRNPHKLRQDLDWVFRTLEAHRLIALYGRDAAANTTYRVISDRGRQLFEEDSYQEFLYGLTRVVERWRPSVLRVVNRGGSGIGTAFVIGRNEVLTAAHVLEEMPNFGLESATGQILDHKNVIAHPDKNVDLALIELEQATSIRSFRIESECDLLDEVVVFGYPPIPQSADAYLVVNRGEVSAKPRLYSGSQEIIVVSCLLRGGNSGGPVVNKLGAVVGVVSRQLFKQVAPDEKSINESLGMAAATSAREIAALM